MGEFYPWPREFIEGNQTSPIAIVTLVEKLDFETEKGGIWEHMRIENLGVEKFIVNVLSDLNIKYLFVCEKETKGQKSGQTFVGLVDNGIDENGKIVIASGTVPYIENLLEGAVEHFRGQIEIVGLLGVIFKEKIQQFVENKLKNNLESFGNSYFAIGMKNKERLKFREKFTLNSSIKVTGRDEA